MSATIEMKLKPWQTPNHAIVDQPPGDREGGPIPLVTVSIRDLSEAALQALTAQWISDIYMKAGKPSPWTNIRSQS